VRALLYERGNVEGEVLDRLIYLDIVLASCCGPEPGVVFLQSAEPPPARLGVRPTPVRAQALLPQLPQGLLPVRVQALRALGPMRGCHRLARFTPLVQSEGGWRCAVRLGQALPQRPEQTAAAVHHTCSLTFPRGPCRRCLPSYLAGLWEEAPTPGPAGLRPSAAGLLRLGFPARLDLAARGAPRWWAVPPDMLDRLARGGLPSGLRRDRLDGCSAAWGGSRAGGGHLAAALWASLQHLPGLVPMR
jgi:hypothetical protein